MKLPKFGLGAVLFCLVHLSHLQGIVCSCDPCIEGNPYPQCTQSCCNLAFDVYADALYWKYSRTDLEAIIEFEPATEYVFVNHDFKWGYRVGGKICCDNWGLGARYTHFDDKKRKARETEEISFDICHDIELKVVDIELGYFCCIPCCNLAIRPLAGAKLAWVDDDFDKFESEQMNRGKMDVRGYGPYVGLATRWEVCSCSPCNSDFSIGLIARATAAILHSKFEIEISEDSSFNSIVPNEYLYVPVQELFLALDFSCRNLCGMDAFFQVGYEVQSWQSWRQWFDIDDTVVWGVGGLVMRFGFGF